ncbi:hypothetical protein YTPLAS18_12470 [Nitrospira sp.]|nr:hypothetical protein YTPLAS18_12470 [Nitrospira sp.]
MIALAPLPETRYARAAVGGWLAAMVVAAGLLLLGGRRERPLTRRERRQRLMAMCVLAYIGPLFMADPHNVDNWIRAFCLDSARAAMFTPTETNQTVTYAYDDNGNLVTETVDDGSGPELSKLYAYDAQNRLIYVDPSPADSVQTDITTYVYDADGARVMRSKNGSTTRYVLDRNTAYAQVLEEWNVAAEPWVAGADKLNVRYVYGDDRIAQRRPTASGEKVRWYLHDGQMSTRQLVDETGVVTDHYTYDTFGGEVAKHGSTTNAFRGFGQRVLLPAGPLVRPDAGPLPHPRPVRRIHAGPDVAA